MGREDLALVISIVSAVVAAMAWMHDRVVYRGPRMSLENRSDMQHAVILPFATLPAAVRDIFPEYSTGLKYALVKAVWLNLGDRPGYVWIKSLSATAAGQDLRCSWYSYVSVPAYASHAEPILLRDLDDTSTFDVVITVEFEWYAIWWFWPWTRRKKEVRGEIQAHIMPPPLPGTTTVATAS
jgi:hypothetical protein